MLNDKEIFIIVCNDYTFECQYVDVKILKNMNFWQNMKNQRQNAMNLLCEINDYLINRNKFNRYRIEIACKNFEFDCID